MQDRDTASAATPVPRGGGLRSRMSGWWPWAAKASHFSYQPEPWTLGDTQRGAALIAERPTFAGGSIWDLGSADPGRLAELHGFGWLDDLAAHGGATARQTARRWTHEWVARHGGRGAGTGPGWAPMLAARRLLRLIGHGALLTDGLSREQTAGFFGSLARQTELLAARAPSTAPGAQRMAAPAAVVIASLALAGLERLALPAAKLLGVACRDSIDRDGAIGSRSPSELLEVIEYLTWSDQALRLSGHVPHKDQTDALARAVPVLRALLHADGSLARFHGGDAADPGRPERALAATGLRAGAPLGRAMGFARLAAGRTTIIVDAAAPPAGLADVTAHACTLALELTSGRRPVIVNCGSGARFGANWARAARATPSHSTLCIQGQSSSRFGAGDVGGHLLEGPREVRCERRASQSGTLLIAGHDGYRVTHGLTHVRQLDLSADGRALHGTDTLGCSDAEDNRRFAAAADRKSADGVAFDIRFHLHPDVDAKLELGGRSVSVGLKSGEVWVFRHDGAASLHLEPSVWLDDGAVAVRNTVQIVLGARVRDFLCQVGWTFAKSEATPKAIRDLVRD